MPEVAKKKRVLVIGTRHEYQRRQDTIPDREPMRDRFEQRLREVIEELDVELIAEEAGDDTAVWEHLKQEDEACGEFAELFGGGKTVEAPVSTIAKQIAEEQDDELEHVDIRAPNAAEMSIEQRDDAMAAKIMEVLGEADSIVVIVGEAHRQGVAQRLSENDLDVESFCFPE
jgi:pheromone shutdown protein TraB